MIRTRRAILGYVLLSLLTAGAWPSFGVMLSMVPTNRRRMPLQERPVLFN
jgi:hypothetical protein